MAIPVGSLEAHFNFSIATTTHAVSFGLGVIDLNLVDPRSPEEIADLMFENWTAAGRPFTAENMPAEYQLDDITIVEYTADGPVGHLSTESLHGTGLQAVVPINCALLVTKVTSLAGRRNKGRMYMPPFLPGESQIDSGGNLTGSVPATVQGWITAARDADLADDIGYVLYHQTGDDSPTPITQLALGSKLATQRRRMRG